MRAGNLDGKWQKSISLVGRFRHCECMEKKQGFLLTALFVNTLLTAPAHATITLNVDATAAPRNLLHAELHIPATSGPLTLVYPKWIPGEHSPSGPINGVTGLKFSVNGQPLEWQRDAEDMFQFHLTVPPGTQAVDVSFDFLLGTGGGYSASGSASTKLLDLSWNQLLLYPLSTNALKTEFTASLTLPTGWKLGTALPGGKTVGNQTSFAPTTLETLVDSPVLAGEFFRTVELTPQESVPHQIHFLADSAAALELKPEDQVRFTRLVHEANALFGVHHYRSYHFLVTMSERVGHFGLEHHESSDDRVSDNFLTEEDARISSADLLPHEMVHSWNGKFRRPAGLATPDYQQPMRGELLWVYEGLTDYLGKVLAARSGLTTTTNFQTAIALVAAMLDHRDGRFWRSLADTTVAAQLLYDASSTGTSRRRSVDFYPEGDLIWLEVDTLIRQQTHGQKSLDDFCKKFHGGGNGAPQVVPYNVTEVLTTLNAIAPYDWKNFFQTRVYAVNPRAPLGGINNSGWRLAYTNEIPALLKIREGQRKYTDVNYSLGFTLGTDGSIGDVLPRSPADRVGVVQGMKLIAVNGQSWSAKVLRDALKTAVTNSAPIELLTLRDDFYQTFRVDYHGGEKYPVLQRDPTKPDLLADILKPLTPEPATNSAAKK
jgi:predicted metalloprotease with PDZ domain